MSTIQIIEDGKNQFLSDYHLDWYEATYIRNYVEFLEYDYLALRHYAEKIYSDDPISLNKYLTELFSAYEYAQDYLGIGLLNEKKFNFTG